MALLKNTTIAGTGYLTLPTSTVATRVATTTTIIRWTNTGTQAVSVLRGTTPTLTATSWTAPTGVNQIELLLVAGGGSGAGGNGGGAGGGGAGGLIYNAFYPVTPGQTYAVTVGAGGASSNGAKAGNDGGYSLFGLGTNLVTNGDFTSNVSGWTDPSSGAEGTFTWSAGTAILASTNASDPPVCVYQAITCVVGKTYMVTANRVGGTASAVVNIVTTVTTGGGSGGFGNVIYFPGSLRTGALTATFTATQTSYFIFLRMNENTNSVNVIFDNIGVYDITQNLIAYGGGGGGCNILPGRPGGSGGGAGEYAVTNAIGYGGLPVPGQGNKGGDCYSTGGAPGGGGAGTPGGHVYSSALGGTGGAGLNFSISGTPTWYAAGGGGSVNGGPGGAGGSGIGGNGGAGSGGSGTVTAGANSTGSGGGGIYVGASGAGGSGVAIIKYNLTAANTDQEGYLTYNTDLKEIETSTNSNRLWNSQDPMKNFGGHNLLPYSQDWTQFTGNYFNNWINSTVTAGQTDPFGGTNAALLTGYYAKISTTISVTANKTYTFSCWLKNSALVNNVNLIIVKGNANAQQGDVTASFTPASIANWTRCSFSYTVQAGITQLQAGVEFGSSKSSNPTGYSVFVYGAQLEEATTLGNYVYTGGVSSPLPVSLAGYRTHAFTTVGTSSFVPSTSGVVEVLVVAGGGSGGGYGGNDGTGGGGAGGLIYNAQYPVMANTTYLVTVGAGGATQPTQGNRGFSGGNSVFGTLVAQGGGGGGSEGTTEARYGGPGGSGGGAGGYGFKLAGAGTVGQGNRGGDCTGPGDGGGGGAGEPGFNGKIGNGGRGLYFAQFANWGYPSGWFAGGGGASGDKRNTFRSPNAAAGYGGLGGGGDGQAGDSASLPVSYNGVANTGGGGGAPAGVTTAGGPGTTFTSGTGGSGIVIVRYRYD
jgi:hypothetical protein